MGCGFQLGPWLRPVDEDGCRGDDLQRFFGDNTTMAVLDLVSALKVAVEKKVAPDFEKPKYSSPQKEVICNVLKVVITMKPTNQDITFCFPFGSGTWPVRS